MASTNAVVLAASTLLVAGCGSGPPPATTNAPPPAVASTDPPAPPVLPAYDPASATATILVRTRAIGPLPRMRPIKFDAEPRCGAQQTGEVLNETIVATDGKLANVIAWVSKGGTRWAHSAPEVEVSLEAKKCMFVPHVVTLQTNQVLSVKNHDPIQVCTHGLPTVNDEFNKVVPSGAPPLGLKFRHEEVAFKVKDDHYLWMNCWVGVLPHPFHGVTDHEGLMMIKVPPGDYEVSAWHEYEKWGSRPGPQSVTVAAGETKEIEFVFDAR